MSFTSDGLSRADLEAIAAGREMRERQEQDERDRDLCRCRAPLAVRMYFGAAACRFCERLIGRAIGSSQHFEAMRVTRKPGGSLDAGFRNVGSTWKPETRR